MSDIDKARAAKRVLARRLSDDPRVSGVGLGKITSEYSVKVNLVSATDRPELPDQVDGVPVEVVVTGRTEARSY